MALEPYARTGANGAVEVVVYDERGREVAMAITPKAAVHLANDLIATATVQSSNYPRPAGQVAGDGYAYLTAWQPHVAPHGHEGFILFPAPGGAPLKFLIEDERLKSFATSLLR